ncbi:MAG: hypothetical protein RIQ70_1558 [Bacteroidota bacterium]|jgi:hypothetical protein
MAYTIPTHRFQTHLALLRILLLKISLFGLWTPLWILMNHKWFVAQGLYRLALRDLNKLKKPLSARPGG